MEDTISRRARETVGDTHRQCVATNKQGERCGRAPIVGGFVCQHHGGAAPQVKVAAQQRLMGMVDSAINALRRALDSHGPPCVHCGRSDADRDPVVVRAAQIVLDRAGFGPQGTLMLDYVKREQEYTRMGIGRTPEELLPKMEAICAQWRSDLGMPPLVESNVIDVECKR